MVSEDQPAPASLYEISKLVQYPQVARTPIDEIPYRPQLEVVAEGASHAIQKKGELIGTTLDVSDEDSLQSSSLSFLAPNPKSRHLAAPTG